MESSLGDLENLIDFIQSEYTEITDQWLRSTRAKINLKKTLISDIDTNGAIYKSIVQYIQFLNEKSASIILQLSSVCSCQVAARVKTQNSIEYKIHHYKTSQHEFGKIPINKCVNDLFGVRIVLDSPLTFTDISAFVHAVYPGKYKCIDSSKLEYQAVHLYFRESNRSFPWELQIWNRCNAESNFASHRKYKQEYTNWEKESREGRIVNG